MKKYYVAIALLMGLSYPSYAQSTKPVIAVGEITSAVDSFNTMSIQLGIENALSKTGKFTIMERTRLASLLKERGLSAAGITQGNASLSGFSGVDYLVYGSVSNITVDRKNQLIVMSCDASLSMTMRVVDMGSGEIRFSDNLTTKKTINTTPVDQDPCAGVSLANINVLGEDATDGIANKMTMSLFPIKVVQMKGTDVYLNYGAGTLSKNDVLAVRSLGEQIIDPDTKEVLGGTETTNAIIVVTEVRAGLSVGQIVFQVSDVALGNVAQVFEATKQTQRAVNTCVSAQVQRQKDCEKDSSGGRCTKAADKVASSCGALLR